MRHRAALFPAIATATAAVLGFGTPASAVVQGFEVRITEVPRTFSAGADPSTVTVVASTNAQGPCQKVRWSMLMQLDGIAFDQVKVQRIENSADFPLQVESKGDTARLTDTRLDPGSLCRGRTVTAQYKISFVDGVTDGTVRLQAEAYDVRSRLLERANATSKVTGEGGQQQNDPEQQDGDKTPDPDQSGAGDDTGAGNSQDTEVNQPQDDDATADPAPSATAGAIAAVPTSADSTGSLLGVGLIVGAILMFLGVGLLLRVRMRLRHKPGDEAFAMAQTRSFDPLP